MASRSFRALETPIFLKESLLEGVEGEEKKDCLTRRNNRVGNGKSARVRPSLLIFSPLHSVASFFPFSSPSLFHLYFNYYLLDAAKGMRGGDFEGGHVS